MLFHVEPALGIIRMWWELLERSGNCLRGVWAQGDERLKGLTGLTLYDSQKAETQSSSNPMCKEK